MTSGKILTEALAIVRSRLAEQEFGGRGKVLLRRNQSGNLNTIQFQTKSGSSNSESKITVGYGTYSVTIGEWAGEDISAASDLSRNHWRRRISDGNQEVWIVIKFDDSVDDLAQRIGSRLPQVISDLDKHSTDVDLCSEWLSGSSPGLTRFECLQYLIVLLNKRRATDELRVAVAELRKLVSGGIHERLVERRLADLGILT